jgi:hypothetical protein
MPGHGSEIAVVVENREVILDAPPAIRLPPIKQNDLPRVTQASAPAIRAER